MFIEHIDQLRCPADHDQSWLVAAFTKRDDRFIIEATLGCPICSKRYRVANGIAYFDVDPESSTITGDVDPDANDAVRIAAFLNVAERSTLVLAGQWAVQSPVVAEMVPLTIFALQPSSSIQDSMSVAILESSEGIPLAANSVRGIALDMLTATPKNLTSAVNVLVTDGRLVVPSSIEVPDGVRLLARDESYWVAAKTAPLIPMRRA